ncbi:MAG TPA: c-type cytochrome [Bacteroidota bacterium]|nr:c-type cytochrome [Bacteroidota bacterium]
MKSVHFAIAFIAVFVLTPSAQSQSARQLVTELACGACHPGVEPAAEIETKAPSLSYAGLRYPEAYLFDYLGNPKRVRLHIGKTQMPNFRLTERERLALVLYLKERLKTDQPLPAFPTIVQSWDRKSPRTAEARKMIVDELKCTFCHKLEGQGGPIALDLVSVGLRAKANWLVQYLALPQAFDPGSPMPAQVYSKDQEKNELKEVIQDAGSKIQVMVSYLMSFGAKERETMEVAYQRVRSANPTVTAEDGARIFEFQNCGGCHAMRGVNQRHNAPDLSTEGSRVHQTWLRSYLAQPHTIRPFGFHPGTGSRMPSYDLTTDELETLTSHLASLKSDVDATFTPTRLSPFSQRKAENILRTQLPCFGCHRFDGKGGMVGPDLSSLKPRLQPTFVYRIIKDPQGTVHESAMPALPLPKSDVELLATFLSTRDKKPQHLPQLNIIDHGNPGRPDTTEAGRLYTHYCSPCHGLRGNGDGFNARYLPVQPAKHSDPSVMSVRSDDTLFDGIYGGGRVLGKSHFMPAFGKTLTREQIWSLVRFIRTLCTCEGPAWSQEGNR